LQGALKLSNTMILSYSDSERTSLLKAYIIFFLAASFYLYEYILQVAPSVMAEPMMRAFQVNAEGFGVISAFYFYAYAPMQLPAGLLFDRYGPRKLITYALMICALGAVFFAATNSVISASFGRLLIGAGSAFSFIGVLVLISRWFPPHYFAVMAGIAQLMSSVGAITGEVPLAGLVELTSWRTASFILATIGFLLAGLTWLVIKDFPNQNTQDKPTRSFKEEWKRLLAVCKRSYTWITGAYAFSIWTPIAVFAALWGIPYLQVKYNVGVITASSLCTMIWIGIGVGSPLLGWLSDRLESRRLSLGLSSCLALFASTILLYVPDVPISLMYLVLFLMGLGAGGQTVSFAVVKDNNSSEYVGTASGFNNLCVLLGGALFQPFVGFILHRYHNWEMINNVPVYSVNSYQNALFVIPVCNIISLLIVAFLLKESHPAKAIRR